MARHPNAALLGWLIASVLGLACPARAGGTVWLSMAPASVAAQPGDTVSGTVNVSSAGGVPGALDVLVQYDPSVLQLIGFTPKSGTGFSPNCYSHSDEASPGQLHIVAFQTTMPEPFRTPVPLGTVLWKTVGAIGTATDAQIRAISVVDEYWQPVEVQSYGQHVDVRTLTTVLSSGYVTPTSGDTSTSFTYRIKYWDTGNRPPDTETGGLPIIYAAIWSGSTKQPKWWRMWPLDPTDSNYTDGAWYTLRMPSLDASDHSFRFAAQTGGQWTYWPQPAGTYQSGPNVTPGNPVVLSSGYITPSAGTPATDFVFRIKYWNSAETAPDGVWVAIWSNSLGGPQWYPMWALDPKDTVYTDGAWYTFHRKWLDTSAHAFRFAAKQGNNWAYWPQPAGQYVSGPAVNR